MIVLCFWRLGRRDPNVSSSRLGPHAPEEESVEREDELKDAMEGDEKREKSLVKKIDRRMSVLVLIYILNCKPPFLCLI